MNTSAKINRNPMLNTSFKLEIPGMETVNYFVQTTELPSITMNGVEAAWQNFGTNVPSNRIEFDPLNCTFIVDEDLANYESIYAWMIQTMQTEPVVPECMRNINLHVTNSSKNLKMTIVFHKAYPTMLGAIPFNSDTGDALPLICNASFRYQYFEIKRQ